jgi:hypothetical protein
MSNWQLARKPIPFPVRRQYDALASPHGLLFREIRNESFPAQQARDTLGSGLGQTATSWGFCVTAALPPKAEIRLRCNICRKGPIAAVSQT